MRSRPKAPIPPKWCIDKRWWQPICELIGELMKEEMPARWAEPLPGGESGAPRPPGVLLAHFGLPCTPLAHSLHTPCTLLAHLLHTPVCEHGMRPQHGAGCQWQESVCNTLLSHPSFFAPPATSTKHFLPTAKNLALAIRRLKPNHEKRWQSV